MINKKNGKIYINTENIKLYFQDEKLENQIELDIQSYIQFNSSNSIQPVFEHSEYGQTKFLYGKYSFQGQIQFNQITLHPLLYLYSNLKQSGNDIIKLLDNQIINVPQLIIKNEYTTQQTILLNVYFIGYQLETTIDGQPIQIVHNMIFEKYI